MNQPARDGRSSRWDQHRVERRGALVESALRAIRTHGAGVGMDEIAAVAGTSKTVLYRHLGDKDQLYLAVAGAVRALVLREVQATLDVAARPGGSSGVLIAAPRDTIYAGIDAYLALVERDPEVYRFVVDRPLLAGLSPGTDPIRGLVVVVGEQVGAALVLAGVTPERASTWGHAVVGMVRGAADVWVLADARVPRHDLVQHLTDLAWDGLASWTA